MSSFTRPMIISAPRARSIAIAVLLGATMLASPLTAARADTGTSAPIQLAQAAAPKSHAGAAATRMKGETVEQRIAELRKALKITPDEEANWNGVAQAMRENAADMEKLIAATRATPPQDRTAVDDLKGYEKFAQAHVDGLKNLISSFEALYNSMPDAQKKLADQVFETNGRKGARSHR